MNPAEVSGAVVAAVRGAVDDGELAVAVPDLVPLTTFGVGSYGSPVALRLAARQALRRRERPRSPAEVAGVIGKRLAEHPELRDVDISDNGFLTIVVASPEALAASIVEAKDGYGTIENARLAGTWPDRPRTFGNPGFCVRYAYSRAAAIQRRAEDLGIPMAGPRLLKTPGLLPQREEGTLLALLAELPSRAALAVRKGDAVHLRRHLECIADAYHGVYERCPALPGGDEEPTNVHAARRTLAEATRIALANGLNMIGESPRERI